MRPTRAYGGTRTDWPAFWRQATARRQSLRLHPTLQAVLDKFLAEPPPDMIGIHARTTDHIHGRKTYGRWPRMIEDVLDQEPGAQFMLATDDPRVASRLVRRFGERIHRMEYKTTRPRRHHRATGAHAAALDLFALAKTRYIVGVRGSSFSLFASELGNIPLKFCKV